MARWRFQGKPVCKTMAQYELWNLMDDGEWHEDTQIAADVGRAANNVRASLKSLGAEQYVPPTLIRPVEAGPADRGNTLQCEDAHLSARWDNAPPGGMVDLTGLDIDNVEYHLTIAACTAEFPIMWEGADLRDRWSGHIYIWKTCDVYMISFGDAQTIGGNVYRAKADMPPFRCVMD